MAKKIGALLMAFVMTISLEVPAFSADENIQTYDDQKDEQEEIYPFAESEENLFGAPEEEPHGEYISYASETAKPEPLPEITETANTASVDADISALENITWEAAFPDESFRSFVWNEIAKHSGVAAAGTAIGKTDAQKIITSTEIICDGKNISSIKGIEYFASLRSLSVAENILSDLDLSKNTELLHLNCSYNRMYSLDLTANTKLETLICKEADIVSLNVSGLTELTRLEVSGNKLMTINLKSNKKLTDLSVSEKLIYSIDLSENTELEYLEFTGSKVTAIDVGSLPKLKRLSVSGNKLTMLDVSANRELEALYCDGNSIRKIITGGNTLEKLKEWNFKDQLIPVKNLPDEIDAESFFGLSEMPGAYISDFSGYDFDEKTITVGKAKGNCGFDYGIKIPVGNRYYVLSGRVYDSDKTYTITLKSNNINDETKVITGVLGMDTRLDHLFGAHDMEHFICGWSRDENAAEIEYGIGDSYNGNSDVILYAVWKETGSSGLTGKTWAEAFPDENFRSAVMEKCIPESLLKESEAITEEEAYYIVSRVSLDVSGCGIDSIAGIEYFISLKYFDCSYNNLETADLSKNTVLTELYCQGNRLSAVNTGSNTVLKTFWCFKNELTGLDVSSNTGLESLYCYANKIETLNLSTNVGLERLRCEKNCITDLDLTKNTELYYLTCYGNDLGELNVTKNTKLRSLYCWGTGLSELDVSRNKELFELYCGRNKLTEIKISGCPELRILYCNGNEITDLDLSKNPYLIELECADNKLAELDISNNFFIKFLDINRNGIKNIVTGENTLEYLVDGMYSSQTVFASEIPSTLNVPELLGVNKEYVKFYDYGRYNSVSGNITFQKPQKEFTLFVHYPIESAYGDILEMEINVVERSACNKVVLDANGGSIYKNVYYYDKTKSISTNLFDVPYLEGYACVGWSTEPVRLCSFFEEAGMPEYSLYAKGIKSEVSGAEETVLYAVWCKAYVVSYNANGGVMYFNDSINGSAMPELVRYEGNVIKLKDCSEFSLTRDGCVFLGWSEDPEAAEPDHLPGNEFELTDDTEFFAVWRKKTADDVALSVENGSGRYGNEVTVGLSIDKNPDIASMSFTISYNKDMLDLIGYEDSGFEGWVLDSSTGKATVDCFGSNFDEAEEILKLKFRIRDTVLRENAGITVTDAEAFDTAGNIVEISPYSGNIEVKDFLWGDVNSDGKVSVIDIIRLNKYLAGTSVKVDMDNADTTADGEVGALDILRLAKYIAGMDVKLGR